MSYTYHFHPVKACAMCGDAAEKHRIIGKRLNGSQGRNPRRKAGITVSVAQCSRCGLIYPNPQPRPAAIEDHYGMPAESYWEDAYFDHDPSYYAPQLRRFQQLSEFRPGMKALDIGAGIGKGMRALEAAGFDVWGIEPSAPFHEKALSRTGLQAERLQQRPIEQAHFPANHFDFISFGAVLEHVYEPGAAIEQSMQWLKPGGLLHVEVPSSRWLVSKLFNFYYRLRGTDYVTHLSPMHAPFHMHEFGLKSFQLHAQAKGYEIAAWEYYPCYSYFPRPIDDLLRWWMGKTDTGMQLEVWMRKR